MTRERCVLRHVMRRVRHEEVCHEEGVSCEGCVMRRVCHEKGAS